MGGAIPSLVAIDTQILIFALRDAYDSEEQRQYSSRAKRLLHEIVETKSRIVLSMITVGEYLVKVNEPDRLKVGQRLMERYLIASYNLRAAVIAAGLVPFAKTLVDGDRPILMADTKIVGTLAAFPCTVFYTYDQENKMAKIAAKHMEVRGLPQQLELDLK